MDDSEIQYSVSLAAEERGWELLLTFLTTLDPSSMEYRTESIIEQRARDFLKAAKIFNRVLTEEPKNE